MAALQLQISPHFLFNTLQALNFEMQRQLGGYQQVNSVIDELSAILQFALKPANHLVTLEEDRTAYPGMEGWENMSIL